MAIIPTIANRVKQRDMSKKDALKEANAIKSASGSNYTAPKKKRK